MTTTINASTSSGLVNTADTSGILQLQTASTAALTIDASQKVGIGTATPYRQLQVGNYSTNAVMALASSSSSTGTLVFATSDSAPGRYIGSLDYNHTSNYLSFTTNATEAMRIDSSGNVGIGTSTPTKRLDASSGTQRGQIAMSGSNVVAIRWATTDPNSGERNWEGVNNVDAQGALSFRVGASQQADPTTTRLAIMPQGAVILSGGSYTTSGVGIAFPATQSASTDANTLDDYEEGTWTPSQGAGLTVVGTFSSFGTYIKIGRQVTVVFRLASTTSLAAASAGIMLGNLPFQQLGTNSVFAAGGAFNNASSAGTVTQVSSTDIYAMTSLAATPNIFGSATYFTNN
jgi:hypothetical protein